MKIKIKGTKRSRVGCALGSVAEHPVAYAAQERGGKQHSCRELVSVHSTVAEHLLYAGPVSGWFGYKHRRWDMENQKQLGTSSAERWGPSV